MTEIDPDALSSWLRGQGFTGCRLEPLEGDVSARRYQRVRADDGTAAIVASYPVELHDACRRFERSTAILSEASVPVPAILASDCDRGLMLVEDVGDRTLFESEGPGRTWVEIALELAARIARLDPDEVVDLNPPLDGPLLRAELRQTIDVFLEPSELLGDASTRTDIELAFERLCAALDAAPAVPCHRDFMVRNLVPGAQGVLYVLDHQDLRLGPPGYDQASLLNDSFYPPHDLEARWVAPYLVDADAEHTYHRAATQRTLKAVGTFAAFAARGSARHLPLIPPTLERALHHLARAPETEAEAPELERLWRPWILSARRPG